MSQDREKRRPVVQDEASNPHSDRTGILAGILEGYSRVLSCGVCKVKEEMSLQVVSALWVGGLIRLGLALAENAVQSLQCIHTASKRHAWVCYDDDVAYVFGGVFQQTINQSVSQPRRYGCVRQTSSSIKYVIVPEWSDQTDRHRDEGMKRDNIEYQHNSD